MVLGTAHPAKFPAAVEAASCVEPALARPSADLMEREERVIVLPNDQSQVEAFDPQNARAVRGQQRDRERTAEAADGRPGLAAHRRA